jgi:radical SAM superfamily enzyme YgiQ (UPF0313 family)
LELKILLINPWVYDFAAADLWARPLGLLKVAEFLGRCNADLSYVDCMDTFKKRKDFGTAKYPKTVLEKPSCLGNVPRRFGRYGMPIETFRDILIRGPSFDMVFITSIMSYWYPGVQKSIEVIRDIFGGIPVVLGGIYATLWHEHAARFSGADFVYRGPVNDGLLFVFSTFGFRLKKQREAIPWHELGLYSQRPFAPLLTSTGCPYECAYCASGLLNEDFVQMDPGVVIEEIRMLYGRGVRDIAFYDDALLFHSDYHIKPILREINSWPGLRFHCPNGLHARFIDDELAHLMRMAGFRTLRLGLETSDGKIQKETGGKVTNEELKRAVRILGKNGFSKKETGVYLMYGLPDQRLESVRDSIRFLKELDVKIHLTEFSPIPGTDYWKRLQKRGILNEHTDPLLTNNTVFSHLFWENNNTDDMNKLKLDVREYNKS